MLSAALPSGVLGGRGTAMRIVLIAAMAVWSSACTFMEPDRSIKGGMIRFGDSNGFLSVDYDGPLTTVSLPHELDPLDCGGWTDGKGKRDPNLTEEEALSRALRGFYHPIYDRSSIAVNCKGAVSTTVLTPSEMLNMEMRRNRVQDRIIMASNQACDAYKRHLLATQSVANYTYGNATLLTAGLGAILKPASTAQALSGAAAILSGSRAEYNDAFFRKLLAEVVTRGISVERQTSLTYILERQKAVIRDYSLQLAIADAINYNSKCTLIVGLENAQKSQSFYADPGLDRLGELLTEDKTSGARLLQRLLDRGADPATPTPPTGPAKPGDPAEPADPASPADPNKPADPSAPQTMRPPE